MTAIPCRTSFLARRHCALTAPAVFDGYRVRRSVAMPSKLVARAVERRGLETNYFSASVAWSTITPRPIVELTARPSAGTALGGRRLGLVQVEQQRLQVVLQRVGLEIRLADRAVDDAGLVGAVTTWPRLRVLHRVGRRPATPCRPSGSASGRADRAAGRACRPRASHPGVAMTTSKLRSPACICSARSSMPTTSAPAALRGFVSLLAGRREHGDAHRLAGAVRQHGRAAHLLVGLLRVDAEAHGDVDRLRRTSPWRSP